MPRSLLLMWFEEYLPEGLSSVQFCDLPVRGEWRAMNSANESL